MKFKLNIQKEYGMTGKSGRKVVLIAILLLICLCLQSTLLAWEYEYINVIKNPAPTMFEKKYVKLVKIKEIDADLGNDEYIFSPTSLAMDRENNLFVYDKLQARVIVLNEKLNFMTSWGRKGRGPGEFSGTGFGHLVFLNIGLDGKLYANDVSAFKVMAFTKQGKYVRDIKYTKHRFFEPIADSGGNLIQIENEGWQVNFVNEKNETLFTFKDEDKMIDYLIFKEFPPYNKVLKKVLPRDIVMMDFVPYALNQLTMRMTPDSTLLIYFRSASILYVVKEKKIVKKIKVWPRDAIDSYKKFVLDKRKENKRYYKGMFFGFFLDGDNANVVYLQLGENKEKKINALYRLDLQGKLLEVLYIELKEGDNVPATRFVLKQNGYFFAKSEDKIYIYKELEK